MNEIIFIVSEPPEGGFAAEALGQSIFSVAGTLEELNEMVRDAVICHFEEESRPDAMRLHFAGKWATLNLLPKSCRRPEVIASVCFSNRPPTGPEKPSTLPVTARPCERSRRVRLHTPGRGASNAPPEAALDAIPGYDETRLQYAGGLPEDTGEESLAE